MSEALDILDQYRSAAKVRDQWRPLWQELSDILHPVRGGFTMPMEPGREAQYEIYDSTPMQARRGLATAIDGLLKPSTARWFWVKANDEGLNEDDEVSRWFEVVGDRMWQAIYAPSSRFISSSGTVDNDLATFGLGHLWIGENSARNGLSFKALHIGDVAYLENADGVIDQYYICRKFTARQAKQRFKETTPPKVLEELAKPSANGAAPKRFEFVQAITTQGDHDPRRSDFRGKPFVSKIVAVEDEKVIEESGFSEMPIATPRWEMSAGQIFPRSPGMMALPDARTLQAMGHTLLVGGQRAVDPPIWLADDGVLSAVRTFPGGLTVVDAEIVRQTGGRPMGHLEMGASIPLGREMQDDYRGMVEAAFFKNVFNLPVEGRQMTATEVMERKEEFLRTIGPVMGQLESDYIGRIIEPVFGIMFRAGAFPPPPDAIRGRDIDFEYMSPIQQARKQIEAAGLGRMMEFMGPLASVDPGAFDHLDVDEIVRDLPEIFAGRKAWLRTPDQVAEIRAGREQAQGMQAALAEMGEAANVGKTVSEAEANVAAIQQPAV